MTKILVTGGAGFIGANFIRYLLRRRADFTVINLDKLTYAGNLENLAGLEKEPRYTFLRGDIAEPEDLEAAFAHRVDAVANFAAESHVDRSILDPMSFVRTNILGTQRLIDFARQYRVPRFLQVSTDEVYGSLGKTGYFQETTPLAPNSPYSASKASADLLVRAAHRTFGFGGIVTRCSNNFGPYQFPEKLIPLVILNAMEEKPIPIYGDGENIRDWIYVEDHCRALELVLEKGIEGEIYNIGGDNERANVQVVRWILRQLGRSQDLIRFVADRPGHDRRYAIDSTKIREDLGFEPRFTFEKALAETIEWYKRNRPWWERVRNGQYTEYYEKQYAERIHAGKPAPG